MLHKVSGFHWEAVDSKPKLTVDRKHRNAGVFLFPKKHLDTHTHKLSRIKKSSKAASQTHPRRPSRPGRTYASVQWLEWFSLAPVRVGGGVGFIRQSEAEELACKELGNHNSSVGVQ